MRRRRVMVSTPARQEWTDARPMKLLRLIVTLLTASVLAVLGAGAWFVGDLAGESPKQFVWLLKRTDRRQNT